MNLLRSIKNNPNVKYLLVIVIVSLYALWPSFSLALTGDDYLGLWRFNDNLYGNETHKYNYFSYLLTDYGPQDSLTALIHHYFGFNSFFYYLISYIFRLLASLSLFPLVKYLSKSTRIAFLATLFFSVTTIGLETTDWSFNLPSYIAIIFFNALLLLILKTTKWAQYKQLLLVIFLLPVTILTQPIRMTFLPVYLTAVEILNIIFNSKNISKSFSILKIALTLLLFIGVLKFTEIGGSIGFRDSNLNADTGFWNTQIGNYFIGIKDLFDTTNYKHLLNPIAQLGSLVIPTNFLPKSASLYSLSKQIILILLPLLFSFAYLLKLNKKDTNILSWSDALITVGIAWIIYIYRIFIVNNPYPVQTYELVNYITGGFLLLILLATFFTQKTKWVRFSMVISFLLIIIPYIIPWFRSPGLVHQTFGRYLIIPAVGFTLLLSTLAMVYQSKKISPLVLFIPLIIINLYSTRKYLNELNIYRERTMTEKVREGIPYNPNMGNKDKPQVYFFKTDDDELLRHTLLFGFPVIMAFEQDFTYPWSIAYTQNWKEVVCSYYDGSGLKRFNSIPIKKVELSDVYSFNLRANGELTDTTEKTRADLEDIKKEGFPNLDCTPVVI